MIQTLHIQNFQRHKDTTLEFCPGVNVISGTSDVGKSSIIRALLWLLTNKPAGFDFRNWDSERGDKVVAKMCIDVEGTRHTVVRERSETINRYILDGEVFVAMKQGVPDEIADLLAVGAVNLQTQYTPHYLLSASAGEVARCINEACDLSIIDTTIRSINTIATKARSDAADLESELETLHEELVSLDWTQSAQTRLLQITEQVAVINETTTRFKLLDDILFNLQRVQENETVAQQQCKLFGTLPDAARAVEAVQTAQERVSLLQATMMAIETVQVKLQTTVILPQDRLVAAEKACNDVQATASSLSALKRLLFSIQRADEECNTAKAHESVCASDLQEAWMGLEVCPLCGHEVSGGM